MVLDIVTYPDARLRRSTIAVDEITDEIRALVLDMTDTMYARDGVGLAAPQVGRVERIFVLASDILPPGDYGVFINPEIVASRRETEAAVEGCLSFPGVALRIPRATGVKVRATNLEGIQFELECEGFLARAVQHEYDHLDGKLFLDLVSAIKRQAVTKKLRG